MGLFDIFKSKQDNSPAKEDYTKAKEHYDKEEFQESLRTLSYGFRKDVNYVPLYELSANSLEKLGAADEQQLFTAVVTDSSNVNAYTNLGNFYFSVGHYDMAIPFLEKSVELNSFNSETAHDLAICYSRRFRITDAVNTLENIKDKSFWDFYFLDKCKIMAGNTGGVQASIDRLNSSLDKYLNKEEVVFPKLKMAELQEMLHRYNSVSSAHMHIRDWHYIQYGGVILDYFDSGEDYVAGGRYVALWPQANTFKEIAVAFKKLLQETGKQIEAVAALADRDSEIIGRLLAKELAIDFTFYDAHTPVLNSVVVAADSSLLSNEELQTISNGQIIFAANQDWLSNTMICPDVIGFMSQTCNFPWSGGGMCFNEETKQVDRVAADERNANEIAEEIYGHTPEKEPAAGDIAFYAQHKDYLKGIGHKAGNLRFNFMIESPVAGSYFA